MQIIKSRKINKKQQKSKVYNNNNFNNPINNADNKKSRKKNTKKKLHILRKLFFTLLAIIIIGIFFGLGVIKGILDSTPTVNMSAFTRVHSATIIYDRNGNETDKLVTSGSNRIIASSSEIPEHVKNAFVAIEDEDFWKHHGIDLNSIGRAIYGVLSSDSSLGGGSTITQQLVKNAIFDAGLNEKGFEKFIRKLQEIYIALIYEAQGSRALESLNSDTISYLSNNQSQYEIKNEILTNYLNIINLGANTLGVKMASIRYFNKDIKDLTISEAAVLASISKNPTKFNPITHPDENARRRKQVLSKMLKNKYITQQEYDVALADDIYSKIDYNNIVTDTQRTKVYSYFTDALISQVEKDLDEYYIKLGENSKTSRQQLVNSLLYSGGLRIYTTLDQNIQDIVDKHINTESNYEVKKYSIDYRLSVVHSDDTQSNYSQINIDDYEKNTIKNKKYTGIFTSKQEADNVINAFKKYVVKDSDEVIGETVNYVLEPQVSFVVLDHKTGEVLAINGGRGEKKLSRTLNRAYDTKRQPGSTFKVLSCFAPALEWFNKSLATTYYDSEYFYKEKQFKNWYTKGYLGFQNIRAGIVYSLNIIAIRCIMETVTPEKGIEFAQKLGITTLTKEDYNPASALGGLTNGVSNLELTNAFSAIANEGIFNKYKFYTKITKIDERNNNQEIVIIDNSKNQGTKVLSKENAFLLTDAMKDSMISHKCYSGSISVTSTSTRAHFQGMSLAGKSGTTTNNKDVWFIGYSPYYTAGVWGGCDDNQSLEDSKNKINNGGTKYHKNIWRKIMQDLHKDKKDIGFTKPSSIVSKSVCRKSGLIATDGCKNDLRGNCSYTEYFVDGYQPTKKCTFHNINGTVNIPNKYQGLVTDDTPYQDYGNMVIPQIDNVGPIVTPIIN